MIQYRQVFLEYKSSSDNATWNKTGFFDSVKVDIPSQPEQEEIVGKYERLEEFESKLNELIFKIEHLTTRQLTVEC